MMICDLRTFHLNPTKTLMQKDSENGWNVTSVYRTATGNNMDGYHVIYQGVYTKGIDISHKKPLDVF
jgi:hypothetical protein